MPSLAYLEWVYLVGEALVELAGDAPVLLDQGPEDVTLLAVRQVEHYR